MGSEKIIFHVDVNSAFLSWSAVHRLKGGEEIDLRTIPAIIGHDEGRGVVLAKSELAKKFNIITGESIYVAKRKCPNIVIVNPDFNIYNHFSKAMMELLGDYTPYIEQYSIDECFMDMTNFLEGEPVKMANDIRNRVYEELGFTVNVGISCNKVLAKMGSELKKPNLVHTLFPEEMKTKLWPLPVGELFMVGRRSEAKLKEIGIMTIGDLAKYNEITLKKIFKSYGSLIWNYANGIDNSAIESNDDYQVKIISNSNTFSRDIGNRSEAHRALISLCDNVSSRLRKTNRFCQSISVTVRNSNFKNYSHQRKLKNPTDSTKLIYETAKDLFDAIWKGETIRLLGVALSNLEDEENEQISMFNNVSVDKKSKALDKVMDDIKSKYGENAVIRSVFLENKK
jgi:DNA polymerase IV